jgi:hypothetical protein
MNRRRKFADELLWLNIVPAANDLPLETDELPQAVVENLHIAVMLRGEVTSVRQLSLQPLFSSSSSIFFALDPVSFTKMTCEVLPPFMITKPLSQLT